MNSSFIAFTSQKLFCIVFGDNEQFIHCIQCYVTRFYSVTCHRLAMSCFCVDSFLRNWVGQCTSLAWRRQFWMHWIFLIVVFWKSLALWKQKWCIPLLHGYDLSFHLPFVVAIFSGDFLTCCCHCIVKSRLTWKHFHMCLGFDATIAHVKVSWSSLNQLAQWCHLGNVHCFCFNWCSGAF